MATRRGRDRRAVRRARDAELDAVLEATDATPPVAPHDEVLFDVAACTDELSASPRLAVEPDAETSMPLGARSRAAGTTADVPVEAERDSLERLPAAREESTGDGAGDDSGNDGRRASSARTRRGRSSHTRRRHAAGAAAETATTPAADERPERLDADHGTARHARGARVRSRAASVAKRTLTVLLIVVVMLAAVYGMAVGVNALARWNARRVAALTAAPASPAKDNLLVIGVSNGVAIGFTALKAERSSGRVLGIAIPEGAFLEVPGQGFERVGDSYASGPAVSMDAVTNFLSVPFHAYVVVDGTAYQDMLKSQDVSGLMRVVTSTDLTTQQRTSFTQYFGSVNTKNVWIVPLPVKAVAVGDQSYFEPQRPQIADLLLQWWGVQASQQVSTPRVIVYNGVGTPGIAGIAAQQLIRAGLKVVDSGNADNFSHATTLILLYHGTQVDAQRVRTALGIGQIVVQSASEQVTDMIVIIGADYKPPAGALSTVPTQGVQ
jgi:hypothetical protein